MPKSISRGTITVLAGINGAGKSSVAGAYLRHEGGDYYNPDEFTRELIQRNPGIAPATANSLAWTQGKERLEQAIANGTDFVFETTLGARTIPDLLLKATQSRMTVRIWFVGLASVELHLRRVADRVASGGHDIPEEKIRMRWQTSRLNLIRLLPHIAELMLWDNSADANFPSSAPQPHLLLHVKDGAILAPKDLTRTPDWAKPIVAAAIKVTS
jgi:predicted ABC-type ATPase